MASHLDHKSTDRHKQQLAGPVFGPHCVALRSSLEEAEEDWLSQGFSQSSWLCRDKSLEKRMTSVKKKCGLDPTNKCACLLKERCPQRTETGLVKEKKADDDITEHLCSRHGKRMKSILQECSEELKSQHGETSLMQVECTPLSPHPPLLQSSPQRLTSASPLHDSSSTNISLFSHLESFSYLSGDDEPQVITSQPMDSSQTSLAQENYYSHISGQKDNTAPECSVQLITSSSSCSVQRSSTQTSSTNISPFTENKLMIEQESSPTLPLKKMCQEYSYHQPVSSTSSSSSSYTAAAVTPNCPTDAQVSLSSHVILEPSSTFVGKLKLSLETQAFLLVCKWLQPQVKLYRLSQQECHQATLPDQTQEQSSQEESEYEDVSLDANFLYTDSESDSKASDDSEYVPPKRCRYR